MFKIVETDNYGGDYPDEKFVNIPGIRDRDTAQRLAHAINDCFPVNGPRYWKVVEEGYQLQPGFEP